MNHKLRNVAIRLVEEPPLISETEILSPSDAVSLVGENMKKHAREMLCMKCGKFMALPVHDHIIVGNTKTKGYYSMKANLLIDDSRQAQQVEVATQVDGLRFDIPMVAETTKEPLTIRTKEDVQTYLKQTDSCEVFATNYFDSTIWFRNMAGYECIDDDTAGIIGASREELENYVWNHRKIINSALRGECSYSVEKKDEQPTIRRGRTR